MKYTNNTYIKYDPFAGSDRDVNIRCHVRKIVKTRKEHPCMLADLIGNKQHKISIGERAICDSAIVDGEWGSYYICLPCMDKYLSEDFGIEPNQPPDADRVKVGSGS